MGTIEGGEKFQVIQAEVSRLCGNNCGGGEVSGNSGRSL